MDEDALLAAIHAAPEDDLVRLVYADWLDEHGRPERAEFIRLQCRIALCEATEADQRRAEELESRHAAEWTRHLPVGATWLFDRGFAEELWIESGELLGRRAVWAAVPGVWKLVVSDTTDGSLRAFAAERWNPTWTALRLVEEPRPWLHDGVEYAEAGFRAIAATPQAANLRELDFDWLALGEAAVPALCESPHLANLRALGVPRAAAADPRLVARFGDRLRATWG